VAVIGIAAAAVLWYGVGHRYADGFSLVARAADLHGIVRWAADLDVVPVTERIVNIPARQTSIRARVYAPPPKSRQTVLLVSGLHPAGIEEPRLVSLARKLAEANVTVVTPEISELSRFEITGTLTDRIEETARWLATESGLAPTGRIGLMGISFSGGLSIVAAGRPSLENHLLYVFSFGGHDDLGRVLEYLCSGTAVPHDYGVAVVLLNVADHLVPPEQVAPLRDAVRRFLWASYLDDRVDKAEAARQFAALRELAPHLAEPSASLLDDVNRRDVVHLGPQLLPYIRPYAADPNLSPSRSPDPAVPVFLLHGRDDTVIPASESQHLADRLGGRRRVHLLVTTLISHAEVDQPAHVIDVLKLSGFWGDLLTQ
jgi:dienelactone hydrolase